MKPDTILADSVVSRSRLFRFPDKAKIIEPEQMLRLNLKLSHFDRQNCFDTALLIGARSDSLFYT